MFSNENDNDDFGKDIKNFELLYSPRTKYSKELEIEEQLFTDLTLNFDPITIKIIKKHFKERLGSLNKIEFISILKNHLLSWHQELPNRETMLIKLLGRLFSEVDLNDNGDMEWAEFTNYIIHNSNGTNKQSNTNNPAYRLRFYYPTKIKIDLNDNKDNISHAFYIEKYNLLGIVQEGRSIINFYDCKKFSKLKSNIDLKEIQKEIDELEIKELDTRSEELLQKELKERELKLEKQKEERKKFFEPTKTLSTFQRNYDMPWRNYSKIPKDKFATTTIENFFNATLSSNKSNGFNTKNQFGKTVPSFFPSIENKKKEKKKNEEKTPPKLRRELEKIKHEQTFTKINKKLTVVSTCFINEYDVLLISTTNNKICAWQYLNGEFKNVNGNRDFRIEKNYFKCSILSADSPQNSLSWDSVQKYLFTGQSDGKILKWDLSKPKNLEKEDLDFDKAHNKKEEELHKMNGYDREDAELEKKFFNKKKSGPHIKIPGKENMIITEYKRRNSVSCILLLGKLQLLAASYYNGNIILWDPLLKDFRKYYFDQETGVYSMSYDISKNLLITAGFNHDIFIYDPYIDNSAIYKLSGHNWSLSSIVANEKDSEILSLDILGNIKIWDSQNFLCFQTINLNETMEMKKGPNDNLKKKKLSSNLKMIYLSKIKKFLIYGSKLIIFETDKAQNPDLADDQIILACYYEKITKRIISFCLRKIKFWNIFTGKLNTVYEDPMNNEITALTIDKNIKRAFLGDNTGHIKNFNMKNGKLLKELESHNVEINMLSHSLALNIVVSCSIDNIIKIHDDTELNESEVKKELYIQNGQIKAIAICEKFSRLAIGLSTGLIRFYDIEHFRYDSDVHSDDPNRKFGNDEITCLSPYENADVIFCGHASGKCRFIVTPPSQMKFFEILSFMNIDENEKEKDKDKEKDPLDDGRKYNIPISCVEYDYENKCMFVGDQVGYLKCYDISKLCEMIEFGESKKKGENDPLITLEVIENFKDINVNLKWAVEAHKESIKHIHHVEIEPKIIITTSNDLKIKIFDAKSGIFKDELRQISIKYKPIPIGIRYRVNDPFKSKSEQNYEEHIIMRNELDAFNKENMEDIENQQIGEYSKKITEYNAKEKLWQQVKGVKLKPNQSNKWDLEIDVEKVKQNEQNELNEMIEIVKQKESLIRQTEMLMQQKSIYSDSYKPQFVSEMDEEQLEEFSNVLSQKLRQVKLAISKANLGQNKFNAFEEEQKRKEHMSKAFHEMIKSGLSEEKKIRKPVVKKVIKSRYAFNRKNLNTLGAKIKKYGEDYEEKYNEAMKEIDILARKTRIKFRKNSFNQKKHLYLDFDTNDNII